MSVLDLIDNKAFEKIDNFKPGNPSSLLSGQIAWVPTINLQKIPQVFEFYRKNPRSHEEVEFKIENMKAYRHFSSKKDRKPVPSFPIRDTEEYIINKAKKRPCIFLNRANISVEDQNNKTLTNNKKHLLTNDCLFIPLYSTQSTANKSGFPQELVQRIQFLRYVHLAYLPSVPKSIKAEYSLPKGESVARLDRIFVASPIVPTVTPTDIMLSSDYLEIFWMQVKEYIFKETEEELESLRSLLLEELSKSP